MFSEVFQLAEKISGDTDGAFDITVAPMVNAWGFGFKTGNPPTRQTIDSLRAIVGFHTVSLQDGYVIKKNPKTMLDCSAIAKGYGTDVVARFLKKKGVQNFMVEIGGEIVVNGNSEKLQPWRIGINKYAEGLPGKRYYGGCQVVDKVEDLARERVKKLFGAEFANVQPHSGAQANAAEVRL